MRLKDRPYLRHVTVVPVILVVPVHGGKDAGTLDLRIIDVIIAGLKDQH